MQDRLHGWRVIKQIVARLDGEQLTSELSKGLPSAKWLDSPSYVGLLVAIWTL